MRRLLLFFLLLTTLACRRSPQESVRLGDQALAKKDYSEASLHYRKALQQDAMLGAAYLGLSECELRLGNSAGTFQSLRQAVSLLPARLDVKVRLAEMALAAHRANDTESSFLALALRLSGEVLAGNPNLYEGQLLAGNLAMANRLPSQALPFFRRAQELNPWQDAVVVGLATALYESNESAEAERLARAMIARPGSAPLVDSLLYRRLMAAGRRQDAETLLLERRRDHPNERQPVLLLAAHYFRNENPAAGHEVLGAFVARKEDFSHALLAAGEVYQQARDYVSAEAMYLRGLHEDPAEAATYRRRLATVTLALGKREESQAHWTALLVMHPEDGEAKLAQAGLWLDNGKDEEISKAIRSAKSLESHPTFGLTARLTLGRAYLSKKEYANARAVLSAAMRTAPRDDRPRLLLAVLCLLEDRPAEAQSVLQPLLENPDPDARVRYLAAAALSANQQYLEAWKLVAKLVRDNPNSDTLRLQQGVLAIRLKRFTDAEGIFSKIAAKSRDPRAVAGVAESYVGRQQFDRALRYLEAEAAKQPKAAALLRLLARTSLAAGDVEKGTERLEKLAAANPKSIDVQMALGDAYRNKGKFTDALQQFERAIALNGNSASALLLKAMTLEQAQRNLEAIPVYRKVLETHRANPVAANNLAYLLADSTDPALRREALPLARSAFETDPRNSHFGDTLGWVYLKNGQAEKAVDVYRAIVRAEPGKASYQIHFGQALFAQGNVSAARAVLTSARQNSPTHAEAKEIDQLLTRFGSGSQ